MTTHDFRALCAELVSAWDCVSDSEDSSGYERLKDAVEAIRAALAVEAVGPSDEELLGLMPQLIRDDFAAASRYAAAEAGVKPGIFRVTLNTHALAFARAVLARYGSAPRPISVAERPILKKDLFNDAEGRCWCGTRAFVDERGDLPVDYPPSWEFREPCPEDDCLLPAHALPIPRENADD